MCSARFATSVAELVRDCILVKRRGKDVGVSGGRFPTAARWHSIRTCLESSLCRRQTHGYSREASSTHVARSAVALELSAGLQVAGTRAKRLMRRSQKLLQHVEIDRDVYFRGDLFRLTLPRRGCGWAVGARHDHAQERPVAATVLQLRLL